MTHSPPGRRAPRARRGRDAGPEQWLALPRWRAPLDTLLVLAVVLAAGWLGLVVIPAAAHHGNVTPVAEKAVNLPNKAAPSTGPSTDPSRWTAGPFYTGAPAAPTTEQAIATEAAAVVAPRPPTTRVVPKPTTSHAAPRTTRAPAPKTTVAAAVAAAATTVPPAVTTAPSTTSPPAVTTTPSTTTTTTTTTSNPTTTSPTTSTSSPTG